MKEDIRFIVETIINLSKLDRLESYTNGEILITAEKKGFFKNDRYLLKILNSPSDKENNLLVKASVNDKSVECDIYKVLIVDMFERTGMLDIKLKSKLDWLSGKEELIIPSGYSNFNNLDQSGIALASFKAHMAHSFPELTSKINIKSEKANELIFEFMYGTDDNDSQIFIHYAILLRSAINNCKRCGVKQIIFIDSPNKEYSVYTIEELDKMNLK
jgi:hypothetical protein